STTALAARHKSAASMFSPSDEQPTDRWAFQPSSCTRARMKRALALALFLSGCGGVVAGDPNEQNFTSDVATLLVMEFNGQLVTSTPAAPAGQIRTQLMYTVGHLNAEPGVARLDHLALS